MNEFDLTNYRFGFILDLEGLKALTTKLKEDGMSKLDLRKRVRIQTAQPTKDPLLVKEEEYLQLRRTLSEEKAAFKKRVRRLEQRLEELEDELRAEAKERGVTELNVIAFRPRTRRKVLIDKFAEFLKSIGKKERFFEIAEVPVGRAVEICGEEPLREAGALVYETDPYAAIVEK